MVEAGDIQDPPDWPAVASTQAPARPAPSDVRAGALTDRILVHARSRGVSWFLDLIDQRHSGLVVCDVNVGKAIAKCRRLGYQGLLIGDPMGHTKMCARPDSPFWIPNEHLFDRTLEDVLTYQRVAGADWAMIPTGYIEAGRRDCFKAAARGADMIDRDDTIFAVPLASAWLSDANIDNTIAILGRVHLPKAVYLGGQGDPLKTFTAQPVTNLRRLVEEVDDVSVFATDLAGIDAVVRGARAASIGTGGKLRHIIHPAEEPESARLFGDRSPTLLVPDLAAFYTGGKLYRRFAGIESPTCACGPCGGRALDTFLDGGDTKAAQQHTVATWTAWLNILFNHAPSARPGWWREFCRSGVDAHAMYNTMIRQRNAFTPPRALRLWADLP